MAQREDLEWERHGGSSCVTLGQACALSGPQFPPPGKQEVEVCLSLPAAPPPL